MSNVGKSQLPGGWSEPRAPLSTEQDILDKVKEQYVEKSGTNPLQFLAHLVRTQDVNGTNYIFEVDIGENAYRQLLIFAPQPGQGEPNLVAILPNKTLG